MKIVFYSRANKTTFHNKSFALSLVLNGVDSYIYSCHFLDYQEHD